jgi:uncharacterized membrane protein
MGKVKQTFTEGRKAMRTSRWLWLGVGVCLALWVVLTFMMDLQTGWTHVALVAAVLLAVRAIVAGDAERAG